MNCCGAQVGFPANSQMTYFQNFWGAPTPDIPPISSFAPKGHLGDHVVNHSSGDRFVLLIRAELFEQYPNAVVSAIQAQWAGNVRRLTDTRVNPMFRGEIGTGITFFGFEVNDPGGSDDPAAGRPGWYFVIEEHATEPRFGLEPASGGGSTWNDLSWQDVATTGKFLNPAAAPTTPTREGVTWGASAVAMAYILMRRPVRVALHGKALLGASA